MKVTHKAPSNIALVKYWGKKPGQIPCNPSLSFSLTNAYTETSVTMICKSGENSVITFLFEGEPKISFESKIKKFFTTAVFLLYPKLKEYDFLIESSNSFPHSAGIASSASSMAALALCICEIAGVAIDTDSGLEEVSYLARLGSGSACRSLYNWAAWGAYKGEGSDFHATPVTTIHENFKNIQDTIILVDDTPKNVSSTQGHGCMESNPFAEQRYVNARRRYEELGAILETGDWKNFTHLVEQEALDLHAMMMTSKDYFILLRPGTIALVQALWKRRKKTGVACAFTIDAGPNIHLLYPESSKIAIEEFLDDNKDMYISYMRDWCRK